MVNISKKYLEKDLKSKIWSKFLKEINKTKSEENLTEFLNKFFTQSEIVMLEKRIGIMHLLELGYKYREIGEILDVMPKTISFMKLGFKKSTKVKKARNNVIRKSAEQSFAHKKNSIMPTYSGKGRYRR